MQRSTTCAGWLNHPEYIRWAGTIRPARRMRSTIVSKACPQKRTPNLELNCWGQKPWLATVFTDMARMILNSWWRFCYTICIRILKGKCKPKLWSSLYTQRNGSSVSVPDFLPHATEPLVNLTIAGRLDRRNRQAVDPGMISVAKYHFRRNRNGKSKVIRHKLVSWFLYQQEGGLFLPISLNAGRTRSGRLAFQSVTTRTADRAEVWDYLSGRTQLKKPTKRTLFQRTSWLFWRMMIGGAPKINGTDGGMEK